MEGFEDDGTDYDAGIDAAGRPVVPRRHCGGHTKGSISAKRSHVSPYGIWGNDGSDKRRSEPGDEAEAFASEV